jgi:hypothetical protein
MKFPLGIFYLSFFAGVNPVPCFHFRDNFSSLGLRNRVIKKPTAWVSVASQVCRLPHGGYEWG